MIRYKRYAEPDVPKQRTSLKMLDTNPVVPETPVKIELEPSSGSVSQDGRRRTDGLVPAIEPLTLMAPHDTPRKERKPPKRKIRGAGGNGVESTMPLLTGLERDPAVSE